jgi:hypothetical protein
MSAKIRDKSSSRSGRFKKKLVSENELSKEAPFIEATMAPILSLFSENKISPAECTSIYLIAVLSHRFPGNWLGAKRPSLCLAHDLNVSIKQLMDVGFTFEENILKRLKETNNLGDLFNQFALKSTPETVNRSLLHWSTGRYPLKLMFRIPDSTEVLAQQKHGKRCVSGLTKSERCQTYILGERDALSFTMHDLIHADHFFHHPVSYEGQLGFYGLMDLCLREKFFETQLKNPKFASELDYLISDMNAYAVHLLKCLKAALFHYPSEDENFFEKWLMNIKTNSLQTLAFQELNCPLYQPEIQDQYLLEFLSRFKAPEV